MKKIKPITIFDTTFDDYSYEEYVENCEDNCVEPQGENSEDFYKWCRETTSTNTEEDWFNLKYSNAEREKMPFFIIGSLGLWNGRFDVHSTKIFYSLVDAIKSCLGRDIDNYKVELKEDGIIYVEGFHHDGSNRMELRMVSKKGLSAIQRLIDNGTIVSNNIEFKDEWFKKIHSEDVYF